MRALVLAALLIAVPSGSLAQRYGPARYGGGWYGGGGYRGYGGYVGYRPYYGYGGYRPYYAGYYGYGVWGFLGAMLGTMIAPPPPVYIYLMPPPPATAPPIQQCPDGSTIPMGSQCAALQAPPAAVAPAPLPEPQPAPERG